MAILVRQQAKYVRLDVANSSDGKNIYINMNNDCESLNVAVASSIIMYEINK